MVKIFQNYTSIAHKFLLTRNFMLPYSKGTSVIFSTPHYTKLIELFNQYDTYVIRRDHNILLDTMNHIKNKDFNDYLLKVNRLHLLEKYEKQMLIEGFNNCIILNNDLEMRLKNLLKTLDDCLTIQNSATHSLVDVNTKIKNSIDVLENISENNNRIKINKYYLHDLLKKDIDHCVLEQYGLQGTVDYMKHILYTIYMDEHMYGTMDRFTPSDKKILMDNDIDTNRIPNDIIKSKIHLNINELTDNTYNEIMLCADPQFHSFMFYTKDLCDFLNRIASMLDGKNILTEDIDIISVYVKENKENIVSSLLLNGKDIKFIIANINGRLLNIDITNNKIKSILNKLS